MVSTIVDSSDAAVQIDLGSFRKVASNQPLKHIYRAGAPGEAERVTLGYVARDAAGNHLQFELAYVTGNQEFDLVERGFLAVGEDKREFRARAGHVRIERIDASHLSVSFSGIELVPSDEPGATVLVARSLPDGSIRGAVERLCLIWQASNDAMSDTPLPNSPMQQIVDADWSSQYCSQYASAAP